MDPASVVEPPHDLAAVVDLGGASGAQSPGDINSGEAARRIHEPVARWPKIDEKSTDLAAVVDPAGLGIASPGDINAGE